VDYICSAAETEQKLKYVELRIEMISRIYTIINERGGLAEFNLHDSQAALVH